MLLPASSNTGFKFEFGGAQKLGDYLNNSRMQAGPKTVPASADEADQFCTYVLHGLRAWASSSGSGVQIGCRPCENPG
jgi:hypothetical protein